MNAITLEGVLYCKETALLDFSIEDDAPVRFELLTGVKQLPWSLQVRTDGWELVKFLKYRLTPSSRQSINEEMRSAGLGYYDPSVLLEHQNASTCDDPYWVRFEGRGPQTWEELQRKIGFTVVR